MKRYRLRQFNEIIPAADIVCSYVSLPVELEEQARLPTHERHASRDPCQSSTYADTNDIGSKKLTPVLHGFTEYGIAERV